MPIDDRDNIPNGEEGDGLEAAEPAAESSLDEQQRSIEKSTFSLRNRPIFVAGGILAAAGYAAYSYGLFVWHRPPNDLLLGFSLAVTVAGIVVATAGVGTPKDLARFLGTFVDYVRVFRDAAQAALTAVVGIRLRSESGSVALEIGSSPAIRGQPPRHPTGDRADQLERETLKRLADHIGALGDRANTALVSGVVFVLLGIGIAGYTIINPPTVVDAYDLASRYVSRVSALVLIVSVAFFFLRSYARTLTDVRYMQNEMTNVEMKLLALHTAQKSNRVRLQDQALAELIRTERNGILEHGQSTFDLKRDEVEADAIVRVMDAAAGLAQAGSQSTAKPKRPSTRTTARKAKPKAS